MTGPRTLDQLPTFSEVRSRAYRLLGDVRDELGSDCRPDAMPTARQRAAVGRALRAIGEAKAALDAAVYR